MPVSLGKKFEALIASQLDDCGVCFDRFKDDTAGYKGCLLYTSDAADEL